METGQRPVAAWEMVGTDAYWVVDLITTDLQNYRRDKKDKRDRLAINGGLYAASVGYWLGADGTGKRRPRVFLLGRDERKARALRQAYQSAWELCSKRQAKGEAAWQGDYAYLAETAVAKYLAKLAIAESNVQAFKATADDQPTDGRVVDVPSVLMHPAAVTTAAADVAVVTLTKAVEMFGVKLDEDVRTTDRTKASAERIKSSLKVFLRYVADTGTTPSRHVAQLPYPLYRGRKDSTRRHPRASTSAGEFNRSRQLDRADAACHRWPICR